MSSTPTTGGEGNPTTRVDRVGTTTFDYDWQNRPDDQDQPDGTSIDTRYDGAGNLTRYTQTGPGQPTDEVSYSYDGANQLTTATDPAGTFSYTYNVDGRPTKLTLPSGTGVAINYGYTPRTGKVASITTTGGSGLPTFSYDYRPLNDRADRTDSAASNRD